MKNQSSSIIISLLLGTISYAEAVKQKHLWNSSGLKFMDNETFQEDSPEGYKNAVPFTKSPMTDKELDDREINVNLEEATKLAKESAHKLVQKSKPNKVQGVRMLAELQDWDVDDVEFMGHENYVKKTPKKYKDLVSFEKVNLSTTAMTDQEKEKIAADAEKWAKRAEHHKTLGSLAQQKTYPSEDSHSYISPYSQRDHAFSFDQHDHQNEDQWETETSKRVPGWEAAPDKTLEQLKAEAAAEAKREAALEKASEGVAPTPPSGLAQLTKKHRSHKKHKSHKKHHHHSNRKNGKQTYPSKDSHSYLEPWVQRDHAWSHEQHDNSNENKWEEHTEKIVPGWKAEADKTIEQLKAEAAAAKAKADTDAKTASDSAEKAKGLAQKLSKVQSLAQNKYFRVETESYLTPWTQRDHAWSLDQFEKEQEDDYVAETKLIAPGIEFAQQSSMDPSSLAEAAEALGMRVQLADDAVDATGNPATGDGETAKGDRSKLKTYNQLDHAWTGDQYDMSNEKTWRKATWDLTGYKSDRFIQAGKAPPAKLAQGGDKMVDTLVQQESQIAPQPTQSMAQNKYFRVETKSEIKPYVVRDHAWSIAQHDEANAKEYQEDAPDGYSERMDYKPEPYNKPLDKSGSSSGKSSKASSKVQESVPGDKKVTIVQHTVHKDEAKSLKKEIQAEKKAKKEITKEVEKAVKQETKKEVAKVEAKKEEKKALPKTETPQVPKLAEKKKQAPEGDKKISADKFDDKSKLKDSHISKEVKETVKQAKKEAKQAKKEEKKAKKEAKDNQEKKSKDSKDKKEKKDDKKESKSASKDSKKDSKSASKESKKSVSESDKKADSKAQNKEDKQAIVDAKPHAGLESDVKKEGDKIDNLLSQKKSGSKKNTPANEKPAAKEATKEASKASTPAAAPKKAEAKTLTTTPESAKKPKAESAKSAAPAPAPKAAAKSEEKKTPAEKTAEPKVAAKAAPSAPKAPEAAIKK